MARAVLVLGVVAALAACDGKSDETTVTVNCSACTVLRGARLFDGAKTRPGTLVIKGTRIERVSFGPVTVKAGQVVDLPGKTILPGLIDLHAHLSYTAGPGDANVDTSPLDEQHLKSMLRWGVTTCLDLGASARRIFGCRDRIASGVMRGPGLLAAGPHVSTTGGSFSAEGRPPRDSVVLLDTPSDVSKLSTLWAQKPDLIKVIISGNSPANVSPAALSALVKAAGARGLEVIAHVITTKDVMQGLDAGVRLFAHMPSNDLIDDALAKRLITDKAVIIPTLMSAGRTRQWIEGALDLSAQEVADDVPPGVLKALKDPTHKSFNQAQKDQIAAMVKNRETNLRRCIKAGVSLAAGTDAGTPGNFHGQSLHEELRRYVDAGMTTAEAIASATGKAAQVLGLADRGELEAGRRADLLVVAGDPLVKIEQTRQIHAVYLLGQKIDRDALKVGGAGKLSLKQVTKVAEDKFCLHGSECASGLVCQLWAFRCRPACSSPGACKPGSYCDSKGVNPGGGYCQAGDGCDLFKQDCTNKAACVPRPNSTTLCDGADPSKQPGDACSGVCASGSYCDQGTCLELCHPTDPTQKACTNSGQTCKDLSQGAGQTLGICQ